MANEIDPKKARIERNEYERTRKRMKTGGRTDSVVAALRGGTAPEARQKSGVFGGEKKEVRELNKLARTMDCDNFGPGWEAMNLRQMALGQRLQILANEIMNSVEFKERFAAACSPRDVLQWMEVGAKLERTAMMGVMEAEKLRQEKKEQVGGDKRETLASKALKNPDLVDAIHGLIEDDYEDED